MYYNHQSILLLQLNCIYYICNCILFQNRQIMQILYQYRYTVYKNTNMHQILDYQK
nr:MAG TPA: hypothetical protein [Bacteriophage sp.]